jgi:hypothetical protein
MTQWGVSPYSQQQTQHAQQQHGQHQFPSIVPPSPGHSYHSQGALPSSGYAHLSHQHHQQHGMYGAGTPTTGSYYPAPSPVYGQQQQQQQYVSPSIMHHQQYQMPSPLPQPLPSPAGSVASIGRPESGASTASNQAKLGIDPFAHLAPTGVGNQGQMQATMPAPPLPSPSPPPPAHSAVVPGSQTQAASATLFGTGINLTAYDLSAPAAPKPRASGNPFA